jgi:HAMP domain-containing protein
MTTALPSAVLPSAPARTLGLRTRLLLSTIIPVALCSAAVLLLGYPSLTSGYARLTERSAEQIVYTLANGLRTGDELDTLRQLEAVAAQRQIGFLEYRATDNPRRVLVGNDPLYGLVSLTTVGTPRMGDDPLNQISRALHERPVLEIRELNVSDGRATSLGATNLSSGARTRLTTLPLERKIFVQHALIFERANGSRVVQLAGDGAATDGLRPLFALSVGVEDSEAQALIGTQTRWLLGIIAVAVVVALLIAVLAAQGLTRQILRLARAAERLSLGDLTAPIQTLERDELGALAGALERLRISLKLAFERLKRQA